MTMASELCTDEEWTIFQALSAAATEGRANDLDRLLDTATEPARSRFVQRSTALAFSATKGSPQHDPRRVLDVLLKHGWDINAPASFRDPPILADVIRNESLVRWLLDHGAAPEAPARKHDITPLSMAVRYAPLTTVQLLFEHGASGASGQLAHWATLRPVNDPDTLEILQLLHAKSVPLDDYFYEHHPPSRESYFCRPTPIMNACTIGAFPVVEFLVQHGADPKKRIWIGWDTSLGEETPIDLARKNGFNEIVVFLERALKKQDPHL